MVLADTSVWIQHFRSREARLADLLSDGLVLMHPFVCGELACGNLQNRASLLYDLQTLPPATVASNAEAQQLVEERRLWGRGLGWIDVHLLAAALLSHGGFWTLDKRLAAVSSELGLSW